MLKLMGKKIFTILGSKILFCLNLWIVYTFGTSDFQLISYGFIVWMKGNVDPDQKPADLDLQCFPKKVLGF